MMLDIAMRLDDLCEMFEALRFPSRDEREHPEIETVLAARSSVQAAVVDDEFLASCIFAELRLIEGNALRPGLVPFFVTPESGIRFAFGYWPPEGTPGPHEHTAWTITAVCRNELEVLTYDRDESYRRRELVPKNRFPASAGKVGYIHRPCIHAPINRSPDWSLSFHVTSPRDGEDLGDQDCPLPGLMTRPRLVPARHDHPYASVIAARRRMRRVRVLAATLASMRVTQAPALLARCAAVGSSATSRLIYRSVNRPEPDSAPGLDLRLRRVHKDLTLSYLCAGDMVALYAETARGPVEELAVDGVAREAIAFVVREQAFDVRAIPGGLSQEERMALAEALEETGLYTRTGDDAHISN
ncbi:hypothetical protein [Streptosporangium sp. NPDC000396]|uniref:hypothetical protein n=1 Tax=Streptosporangium sp. NPDC000396 TaxID=3366185 RepID=UPI0036C1C6CC